jgi:hypothetical protein
VSLVGNWTKTGKKEPHCAGERSQQACDRAPGERAPELYERALGERLPRLANVRTRVSLNPAGEWTS